MRRVGRDRVKHKRLPKGWTPIGKAIYFVPTNKADVVIVRFLTGGVMVNGKLEGGKASMRLGARDNENECSITYGKVVEARRARDETKEGTVGELVRLARRDIKPTIENGETKTERERHWKELEALAGTKAYAKSIHEAGTRPLEYFTTLDVQRAIDRNAETRHVAINRAVDSWSLIFDWARTRWGLTQYNPCRGVFKNEENAREVLPEHDQLYRGVRKSEDGQPVPRGIYRQLDPPARFILNMYRYYGRRRSETLQLSLADTQHADGLHMLRAKERQRRGSLKKKERKARVLIIPWEPRLRRMLARALKWRAEKMREGIVTTTLLVNRHGLPYTKEAAKSAWRRGMERSGQRGQFTQHDVRALRASTLPLDVAQNVLAHEDQRTTARKYQRGPKIIDLKGHK